MNPYLQKKAMKAYWKQQKYLAKYGQYGMGGGFYANDIEFDENEMEEKNGEDPNLMGIIHPFSEGSDYQHKTISS